LVCGVSVPHCPKVTYAWGGILNDVTNLDQVVHWWPITSRLEVSDRFSFLEMPGGHKTLIKYHTAEMCQGILDKCMLSPRPIS